MISRILLAVLAAAVLTAALIVSQHGEGPLFVSGFLESDQIRVGSRVGGRIARLHVDEGDPVDEGDVLIELEPFDLAEQRAKAAAEVEAQHAELERLTAGFRKEEIESAKATRDRLAARLAELVAGPRPQEIETAKALVREAGAAHELAKLEFARTSQLVRSKTKPQDELDRVTANLQAAEARVEARNKELELLEAGTRKEVIAAARAELAAAEAGYQLKKNGYRPEDIAKAKASVRASEAALAAIDRRIAELQIRAPSKGVIESLRLRKGDLVGPNAPVLSVLDETRLWVRCYVPENRLSFQVGREVELTVDAYPKRRFKGKVSFIAREAEFVPGNVQTPEERSKQVFRIKVDLIDGRDVLRPGVPVDVWFDRP